MKIINKYVFKEHVGPFFFALSALTSLMLLQYIARKFGDLVGKGLQWQVIADFFVLSIPFTVAMTMPMAVLVAVLYAFSRFGSENEITALKAGGVSTRSLMVPVLVAATALALTMLWFNDQVLPRSNHQLATLENDILRTKPTFALRDQVINTIQDEKLYLSAGKIDRGESSRLQNGVTIYDLSDRAQRRTILADSGVIALAPNGKDLILTLFDGVILSVPVVHPDQLDRLYYHKNRMRVEGVINEFQGTDASVTAKHDREMSICEMQAEFVRAAGQAERSATDYRDDAWMAGGRKGPAPIQRPVVAPRGIGYYYCSLAVKVKVWQRALSMKSVAALPLAPAAAVAIALQQATPAATPSPQQPQPPQGQQVQAGRQLQQVQPPERQPEPQHAVPQQPQPQSPQVIGNNPSTQQTLSAGPPGWTPSVSDVARAGEEYRLLKIGEARYDIEIQKKFSLAAACIVLALVGAPIALRFPRGGVGLVLGVSFTIFALYYVCLIAGESLANDLFLTPFWAMWAANAIFGGVGLILFARMGHESATARGGGAILRSIGDWFSTKFRGGNSAMDRA